MLNVVNYYLTRKFYIKIVSLSQLMHRGLFLKWMLHRNKMYFFYL